MSDKLVEEANRKWVAKDLRGAALLYEEVLRANPYCLDALLNLGWMLLRDKKPERAVVLVRRAVALAELQQYPHTLLGAALVAVGAFAGAEEEFRAALRIAPADLLALYWLAYALRKQRNYRGAIEALERAHRLAPDEAMVLHAWGLSLYYQGLWEEAVQKFEEALERDPKFFSAYNAIWQTRRKQASKGLISWLVALRALMRVIRAIPYHNYKQGPGQQLARNH